MTCKCNKENQRGMVKDCFRHSELALVLSSTEKDGKEFEFNFE